MKTKLILSATLLTTAACFAANKDTNSFTLYKSNTKNAASIDKLSPTTELIKIYTDPKNKNWVKVGLKSNGEVGWIKRDQYHTALDQYYRPDIQTFYISSQQTDKNGKPTVNIVAYKNGKKIDNKAAANLYKQIQRQQAEEYLQMRALEMNSERIFNSSFIPITFTVPDIINSNSENRI